MSEGLRRRTLVSTSGRAGCVLVLAPLVLFGALCSGLLGLSAWSAAPGAFMVAAVLATATTVPHTAILLWLDRHEREPLWLVVAAMAWGAMVATSLSMPFNELAAAVGVSLTGDAVAGQVLAASFSAPWVEEVSKGLALWAIYVVVRRELDDVLDGVIYGALVGLGFAWFENILYYLRAGEADGLVGMVGLSVVRGVLHGAAGHATFTGLTGLGFGIARMSRGAWWRALPPLVGLALAILAHFAWNTFAGVFVVSFGDGALGMALGIPVAVVVLSGPFLLLLLIVVLLSWRHQDRVLTTWLALEDPSLVVPGTLEGLVPARRRTARSMGVLMRQGPLSWWRHRALDHALVELAFARWHHDADHGVDWSADADADVVRWRQRVQVLRQRVGAVPAGR